MSDINPINTALSNRVGRISVDPLGPSSVAGRNTEDVRGRGGARTSDQVEISRVAQYLGQLQSPPTPSSELVARVRDQIEQGVYLTDEKLDAAANELLDDIDL